MEIIRRITRKRNIFIILAGIAAYFYFGSSAGAQTIDEPLVPAPTPVEAPITEPVVIGPVVAGNCAANVSLPLPAKEVSLDCELFDGRKVFLSASSQFIRASVSNGYGDVTTMLSADGFQSSYGAITDSYTATPPYMEFPVERPLDLICSQTALSIDPAYPATITDCQVASEHLAGVSFTMFSAPQSLGISAKFAGIGGLNATVSSSPDYFNPAVTRTSISHGGYFGEMPTYPEGPKGGPVGTKVLV